MSCAENTILFFFATVSVKLTYFSNNLFVLFSLLLRFATFQPRLKISFRFISSIEKWKQAIVKFYNNISSFDWLIRDIIISQNILYYWWDQHSTKILERNFNFCKLAHWKRKFHFQWVADVTRIAGRNHGE